MITKINYLIELASKETERFLLILVTHEVMSAHSVGVELEKSIEIQSVCIQIQF